MALTTFLAYVGAGIISRAERDLADIQKTFAALPVAVYAFYGISYTMPRSIPALRVVALFAMVFPALLALMQTWLEPVGTESSEGVKICAN